MCFSIICGAVIQFYQCTGQNGVIDVEDCEYPDLANEGPGVISRAGASNFRDRDGAVATVVP